MATARDLQRYRRRGKTSERGLDAAHQRLREQLLPAAYGTQCPGPWSGRRSSKCTGLMVDRRRMDLDDKLPRALGGHSARTGGRICCSSCNRSHGARFGNRSRAVRRRALAPSAAADLPVW